VRKVLCSRAMLNTIIVLHEALLDRKCKCDVGINTLERRRVITEGKSWSFNRDGCSETMLFSMSV
jgi:hypothetical protein